MPKSARLSFDSTSLIFSHNNYYCCTNSSLDIILSQLELQGDLSWVKFLVKLSHCLCATYSPTLFCCYWGLNTILLKTFVNTQSAEHTIKQISGRNSIPSFPVHSYPPCSLASLFPCSFPLFSGASAPAKEQNILEPLLAVQVPGGCCLTAAKQNQWGLKSSSHFCRKTRISIF